MESEIRKLRAALARRESGRGRRFTPGLRRQISGVGRRLRDDGTSWSGIGTALGLPTATVRRLCDSDTPDFARGEVVAEPVTVGGLVVVMPKRYLQGGLQHALSEDARRKPDHKLDSSQEAAVVALVCGPPPEGEARWSTRLIAEEVSRRGIVDSIGRETIRVMLARRDLKPWREKNVVRAGDRPGVRRPNGRRAAPARSAVPRE